MLKPWLKIKSIFLCVWLCDNCQTSSRVARPWASGWEQQIICVDHNQQVLTSVLWWLVTHAMPTAVTTVPEVCVDRELFNCCPQLSVKGTPEFWPVSRFFVSGNFEESNQNGHRQRFPHEGTLRVNSQTVGDSGSRMHGVPEISSRRLVWEKEFYVPCLFSSVRIKDGRRRKCVRP